MVKKLIEIHHIDSTFSPLLITWLLVSTLALTAASLSRAYLQPMAKVEPPPTVHDPVMPVSRAELFFR